jgi:3-hydroxyacyl-[acyl-carrier-protein] dehydratase
MNAPIQSLLRQLPPFLFVSSYESLGEEGIETTYHVSGAEPFFEGHFPGEPVFPGVLIIEAMAQAARIALADQFGERKAGFLAGVSKARFSKPVIPPQNLRIRAVLQDPNQVLVTNFANAKCTAFIGRHRAARADIQLSIREALVAA